jgi:hypothetical protein
VNDELEMQDDENEWASCCTTRSSTWDSGCAKTGVKGDEFGVQSG